MILVQHQYICIKKINYKEELYNHSCKTQGSLLIQWYNLAIFIVMSNIKDCFTFHIVNFTTTQQHTHKNIQYVQFQMWSKITPNTIFVATLTLASRRRQGLAKVRAKSELESYISCFRKSKRVWGNEHPHSQVSSHFGSWSPNGLPNFQKAIVGVKSHWIENFLISLKSSWNKYV